MGGATLIIAAAIVGGIHGISILSLPVQYVIDGKICVDTGPGTISEYKCDNNVGGRARSVLTLISWFFIPLTAVLLDNNSVDLSFSTISSAQATKLKLNNEAVDTYNQELNEINAIAESTQKIAFSSFEYIPFNLKKKFIGILVL